MTHFLLISAAGMPAAQDQGGEGGNGGRPGGSFQLPGTPASLCRGLSVCFRECE